MLVQSTRKARGRLLTRIAALVLAALLSTAPVLLQEMTALSTVPTAQACGSQSGGC